MPKELSLEQKLRVLDEAAETGNLKKSRRNVMCIHLRFANGEKTMKILSQEHPHPHRLTLHPAEKARDIELETQLCNWIT